MEYVFEKSHVKDEYQVRLNGEFIMYVKDNSPQVVDDILKSYGWANKEQYYENLMRKFK